MKKVLSLCLAISMLSGVMALALQTVHAQEAGVSLTLEPATGSYELDNTFDIELKLNTGGAESDHTEAYLEYDPTLLQVVDADEEEVGVQISPGELYETVLANLADEEEGTIEFSQLSLNPEAYYSTSEAQVLATITFQVLAAGETNLNFVFTGAEQDLEDSNVYNAETNEDMLTSVEGATFTLTDSTNIEETPEEETVVPDEALDPVLTSVFITSNKTALAADGADETTITVTVLDDNDLAMTDEVIDLVGDGDGTLTETVLTTNADGQASTVYRAGIAVGEVNITATSRSNTALQASLVLSQTAVAAEEPEEPAVTEEPAEQDLVPVPGEGVPEETTEVENGPEDLTEVGAGHIASIVLAALVLSGLIYEVRRNHI